MRITMLTFGLLTAFAAGTPASAFEHERSGKQATLVLYALEPQAPVPRRAGRTFAAFDIGDQAMTLTAYGRRARARAMGNADDVHQARAMRKVFTGAPQPALLTLELSLRF